MESRAAARVDSQGRAFAGSQRWIQHWVNFRTRALNGAIAGAFPEWNSEAGDLEWVSPLQRDGFVEYRDDDFLHRVGLASYCADLRRFWPAGGPCWDALARLPAGPQGVVLVEAKSYPREMLSVGCQAGPQSLAKINRAMENTKRWVGAAADANWLGPAYQFANRLAHLYFFREIIRVPAWLVNVYFIDDPRLPTSRSEWEAASLDMMKSLGLDLAHPPFVASIFLKAEAAE